MELATRAHCATLSPPARRPDATAVARTLWKATSAATSLLLVGGAIVYGVALGTSAPSVSPVGVDPVHVAVSGTASEGSDGSVDTAAGADGR